MTVSQVIHWSVSTVLLFFSSLLIKKSTMGGVGEGYEQFNLSFKICHNYACFSEPTAQHTTSAEAISSYGISVRDKLMTY